MLTKLMTDERKREIERIVTKWSGKKSYWERNPKLWQGEKLTCDWGHWNDRQIGQALAWHEMETIYQKHNKD